MDGEAIEQKRVETIAQIEAEASDAERTVAIDAKWLKQFQSPSRPRALACPPLESGDETVMITAESHNHLREWYPDVWVKFCVVNGEAVDDVLADPEASVGSLLPETNPLDLYRGSLDTPRISSLDYFSVEPLEAATLVKDLNGDRIVLVEFKMTGTTGLQNLGNSCYMNSSLQCLTHIQELVEYFISGQYKNDVNVDNPIGYKGAAAEAFAALVNSLYCGQGTSFSPSSFKTTMGRFNRSFAGYLQQDSQEFTAFLLDALHEDLNRIKQKPMTEKPELPDDKVNDQDAIVSLANECWDLHKKRNDSIILDLFTGMYKSTLVCPECARVSITFDPFGDLTLPFPSLTVWLHPIYFFALDGGMYTFEISLQTHSSIAQLKQQVLKVIGRQCSLEVVEVHASKIWQWFNDNDTVGDKIGKDDTIAVYETTDRALTVFSQQGHYYFGSPFLVQVGEEDTLEQVRVKLAAAFSNVYDVSDAKFRISRKTGRGPHETMIYMQGVESLEPEQEETEEPEEPEETITVNEDEDVNMEPSNGLVSPPNESSEHVEGSPEFQTEVPRSEPFEIVETPEPASDAPLKQARNASPESESSPEATKLPLFGPYDAIICSFDEELLLKEPETLENPIATGTRDKLRSKKDLNLEDCFDLFSTPEVLGENDLWYCSKCKEFRQATKQLELWKCPDIFTIHLKRFRDIHSSRDKISDVVDFPIEGLDMTKRVLGANGEQLIYDLIAVDNHFGGLGGGHYTAFAKNPIDHKWYYFNDSTVSAANPEDSVTGAAYLLFYRKRSNKPLGGVTADFNQVMEEVMDKSRIELREKIEKRHQLASKQDEDELPTYSSRFAGSGNRLGSGSDDNRSVAALWGEGSSFLDVKPSESDVSPQGADDNDNAAEATPSISPPTEELSNDDEDEDEEMETH